jgi:hypothetical protein
VIASPSPASLPLPLLAGRSGADLRLSLDALLRENAFLSAATMEAASSARLDELIGVSTMLDENVTTLAEIVGTLKGQAAAVALLDAWRGHNADLVSYAQSGQSSDSVADLDRRRTVIAGLLATGEFTRAQADDALQQRGQAELALADSLIGHDAAQSVQRLVALESSSDGLGGPLAAAMAAQLADLLPPTTIGADVDLRLQIASALQAHVFLTGAAVEAAADGRSAESQAFATAEGSAADELGAGLGSAYGANVGSGVAERLKGQTAAMVSAATGGDRRQAAQDIDRLRGEIDGLLAGANMLLAPGLISQQLRASDQPLLTAGDAFVGRDFQSAYARLHEAAHQSAKPADTLALAMVDRYPGRYLATPTPSPPGRGLG